MDSSAKSKLSTQLNTEHFMIGVATAELRNKSDQYNNNNSLCIRADGYLYSDGKSQNHNFQLNTGDVVTVRRSSQQIEWVRGGQLLCAAPIPNHIHGAPLFPVLWIGSYRTAEQTSKLRFV
jgi:hypothetical protein